jgi:predicted dehydrogenase
MRLAIIGSGSVSEFHIQAALKAGFSISAIAASDYSKSANYLHKKYDIPKYFVTTTELLNSNFYDCLLLSIQPEVTENLLSHIVDKEVPILIEKPVVLDSKKLEDFESNNKICVGYNRRYYSTINELYATQLVKPGFFHFSIVETTLDKKFNPFEIQQILLKNTVHFFDLIHFLIPNFNLVDFAFSAHNLNSNWRIFQNQKFVGSLSLSFNSKKNSFIEFENYHENLVLKPLENLYKYDILRKLPPRRNIPYKRYKPSNSNSLENSFIKELGFFKPGFLGQHQDFFDFCTTKIRPMKLASLKDAKNALQTAEIVFRNISEHLK